jgi:hypothetical protein
MAKRSLLSRCPSYMLCEVQDETELCSGVAAYCVKSVLMYMLCALQDETNLLSHRLKHVAAF